jgi:GNAT superfamily N-acetyltransferase
LTDDSGDGTADEEAIDSQEHGGRVRAVDEEGNVVDDAFAAVVKPTIEPRKSVLTDTLCRRLRPVEYDRYLPRLLRLFDNFENDGYWNERWSLEERTRFLLDAFRLHSDVCVAETEEDVVAIGIGYRLSSERAHHLRLADFGIEAGDYYNGLIAIDPPFRGSDIKDHLIAMREAAARSQGARRVVTRTLVSLHKVIESYEARGYVRQSNTIPWFEGGRTSQRIVLIRSLDAHP